MLDTAPRLLATNFPAIRRRRLHTLQVNLGYVCNQSCLHCHVAAGPGRTEFMSRETVDLVLEVVERKRISTLDLTGGAPELNPSFRYLVCEARRLGSEVIDRCNLTILSEPGQEDLAAFLAEQAVQVVASLPCYLEQNVDAQRGEGVFRKSIEGLRLLNEQGYGRREGLSLSLVYNPQDASLPPSQSMLEADYKRHLLERYGVCFSNLLTLVNMPIKRFGSALLSRGVFDEYMELLRGAHRQANLETVMCRELISVNWQGYLFDCDFNQMLNLPPMLAGEHRPHLQSLLQGEVTGNPIRVAEHCYGCTAGQGSSCGGALQA